MKLGRLRAEATVFFQCDIQERFRPLIWMMPAVIHVAVLMAKSARIMGIPLVVTEQYPKALGHTLPEVQAAWGGAPAVLAEKTRFSMCVPSVLQGLQGRKSVVLYGIEGHVCVQQTCLDLLEQGYTVHLLTDGISSQVPIDRSTALLRMREAGALLTTSESVVFELMRDTKYAHFKAVSDLVKQRNPTPIPSL